MEVESIKNVNITVLFSAPINHLLITQKDLLDLFKTEDQQKNIHTFIEAPGLKVLIFPNRQKEIVFEASRVLINEKTGNSPEQSEVIEDFQKLIEKNIVEQDKITAYGFNYDIIILPKNGSFTINDIIGSKISALSENIKSAGVNIAFDKDNIKHTLEITPIGNGEQRFIAHLNVHYAKGLPNFEELKKEINVLFEEFKNIIKKI